MNAKHRPLAFTNALTVDVEDYFQVSALAPVIGYDKAAKIAKVAAETNRTVREVAYELSGLSKDKVNELLDPRKQTGS